LVGVGVYKAHKGSLAGCSGGGSGLALGGGLHSGGSFGWAGAGAGKGNQCEQEGVSFHGRVCVLRLLRAAGGGGCYRADGDPEFALLRWKLLQVVGNGTPVRAGGMNFTHRSNKFPWERVNASETRGRIQVAAGAAQEFHFL
jgi:hypothetical protein